MNMAPHFTFVLFFVFVPYSSHAALTCSYNSMPKVQNATLTAFFPNKHAIFTCLPKNVIESTSLTKQKLACTTAGWGGAKPCVWKVPTCKTPSLWKAKFPMFNDTHPAGSHVIITCPKNYRLVDDFADGKITCLTDGWDVQEHDLDDVCERDTCKVSNSWKMSASNSFRDEYWHGQKVAILCPNNKMAPGLLAKGGIVSCLPKGKWDVKAKRLCNVTGDRCIIPQILKDAFKKRSFRDGYLDGERVIFGKCSPAYPMTPALIATNGVITCRNGAWDVKKPCRVSYCKYTKEWRHMIESGNLDDMPNILTGEKIRMENCGSRIPSEAMVRNRGWMKCLPGGKWSITPSKMCLKPSHNSYQADPMAGPAGTRIKGPSCEMPLQWKLALNVPPRTRIPAGEKLDVRGCPNKPLAVIQSGGFVTCGKDGTLSPKPKKICNDVCFVPFEWRVILHSRRGRRPQLIVPAGRGGPIECPPGWNLHPDIVAAGGKLFCDRNGRWSVKPDTLCVPRSPKLKALFGGKCRLPKHWQEFFATDQRFITGGFGTSGFSCTLGTVKNPYFAAKRGLHCLPTGHWDPDVDHRQHPCITPKESLDMHAG